MSGRMTNTRSVSEAAAEGVGPGTALHPFASLKAAIHADPEYAWGWLCNLAVPIMDAIGASHTASNRAAALIMAQMFDYDITKHPHYEGGKFPAQEYFELRVACERDEDAAIALAKQEDGNVG